MAADTLIPLVTLPCVYHLGELTFTETSTVVGMPHTVTRQWHFEHGLFSVSLDPHHWTRHRSGEIYELVRADGDELRLIDVDLLLAERSVEVLAAAQAYSFANSDGVLTQRGYSGLGLVDGGEPPEGITLKQASLEACAAILANQDPTIDGLWWSSGVIEIPRGGIFQHKLNGIVANANSMPSSVLTAPAAVWTASPVAWGR